MVRVLSVTFVVLLTAVTARASPWWASWSGDSYPETGDWTHYASDPPAQRWLEDGKLFIDSRADWYISDSYSQVRPGEMTLGPGETLVVSWRIKVDEVIPIGGDDPAVYIGSDDQYAVSLLLGTSRIYSFYETDKSAPFSPGVLHEFTFQSNDMRTYQLLIDGAPAFQGTFFESLFYFPSVGWGDMTSNRSLAEWDWVECGITPEPAGWLCVLVALCIWRSVQRSVRA